MILEEREHYAGCGRRLCRRDECAYIFQSEYGGRGTRELAEAEVRIFRNITKLSAILVVSSDE
jgi:hypothetical protein